MERAPDCNSGCRGFDSRTNTAGECPLECGPREAGQRVIGRRRSGSGVSSDTHLARGSTAECHAVRGYRFRRPRPARRSMLAPVQGGMPPTQSAERNPPRSRRSEENSNSTPHLSV